jgi:hypothetical protein
VPSALRIFAELLAKKMNKSERQPALLTRKEIEWLLNNSRISKAYEYRMKSNIRKKLRIFAELEFPLIQKSGIFPESLTVFGKDLTTFSKEDNPLNTSNIENCVQNMVGRKGFLLCTM